MIASPRSTPHRAKPITCSQKCVEKEVQKVIDRQTREIPFELTVLRSTSTM